MTSIPARTGSDNVATSRSPVTSVLNTDTREGRDNHTVTTWNEMRWMLATFTTQREDPYGCSRNYIGADDSMLSESSRQITTAAGSRWRGWSRC